MLQNLLPKNLPNLQNNQDLKKELNLITEKLTNDNFTLQQKNTILNRLIILTLFSSAGLLTLSYLNFSSQAQKNVLNERIQTINSKNESQWANIRSARNNMLKDSDWTALVDVSLSTEKKSEWAIYRQALRDITTQQNPFDITWPTVPNK